MKVFNTIIKIVIALAAIAGAVYVAATYGDKIVAWCKKMLGCNCGCCETAECEIVEEPAAVEETEEAPAAEEGEAVAAESDFEG